MTFFTNIDSATVNSLIIFAARTAKSTFAEGQRMPAPAFPITADTFTTFGDLLRYLRRRQGLTQSELSAAVGYSHAQISRLEQNHRPPDLTVLAARFLPALQIEDDQNIVSRLFDLAALGPISPTASGRRLTPQHNLPIQLTSFVEREQELINIEQLLARSPLITLTGPGGCGKTRLALEAGWRLADHYRDGVWMVELAPISDPYLVPDKIAATLGLRQELSRPLSDTLSDYLRDKRLLLLLDNCEHLVGACAHLAETLLQAAAEVRILATSREALGIAGEITWRVLPLTLPEAQPASPLLALALSDAAQLFIARAKTASSDFDLTAQNAPALIEVCRRLDGLPLAIELAAARVPLLNVEQIAARLDDSFRLLTTGSRTADARHQTLQALMDWSYDLLSEPERAFFCRLAVFIGGWTLEAAQAICAGGKAEQAVVLDMLTRLVNKSWVIVDRRPGQPARYRLLETVRAYALAQLVERGEVDAIRQQHAHFFLALAEDAEPSHNSPDSAWLKRLEPERDTFRAVLDWALERDADAGFRMVGALWWFWFHIGDFSEGRRLFDRVTTRTGSHKKSPERARALYAAASCARAQGDFAAARAFDEECVAIWRSMPAGPSLAYALGHLGRVELAQGDLVPARQNLEESIGLLRAIDHQWGLGKSLMWLGGVTAAEGDDIGAQALYLESITLARALGETPCLAVTLCFLGYVACRRSDYAAAGSYFKESLCIWREVPDPWSTAWGLEGLAWTVGAQGRPDAAARLYGAGEALQVVVGTQADPFEHADYARIVASVRAQLTEEAFLKAWAEGRTMPIERAIDYALEVLRD